MSTMFAFLATLPALKSKTPPVMPDWSSLRQSKKARLDIRPVVWSLLNKPEDWKWGYNNYTIYHVKSNHQFWVTSGPYRLYGADHCSCQQVADGTGFSIAQRYKFGVAFRAWKRWERTQRVVPRVEAINKEFRQHFV